MLREIRHALRILFMNPGFTAVAVAAIALGIGANTAIFSIVRAVILEPLPFVEPGRLVMVWETRPDFGRFRNVVSDANFLDWRSRSQVFDAMSPVFFRTAAVIGGGEPEEVRVESVGEDFFPMLGIPLQIGRAFTAEECKPGAPTVAILSDAYWRSRFSADPRITDRAIRIGVDSVSIIGVAAVGAMTIGDHTPALWRNARVGATYPDGRRSAGRNMTVLARLRRGISLEEANRHMVTVARGLEQEFPEFNSNWSACVTPLVDEFTGKAKTPLLILLGAVVCVLLIACANVANLLLARMASRGRELAVRVSLGATRAALARQLLAETMTIAAIGSAVGVAIGWWLLQMLREIGPGELRRLGRATLDPSVLVFTLGLTLLTGLLLGIAPALTAVRGSASLAMRDGGRVATLGSRANRLRDTFTVAQVALSLMLLAGAGLLLKSFVRLTAVQPGFRPERVLTATLSLPGNKYRDQKGVQFFGELNRRVRALPGVVNASNITFLPFKGPGSGTYYWRDDKPKPASGQEPVTDVRMVQPRYFETMNIPLLRGRTFTDADNDPSSPLRFVITESVAKILFPGEDPIGRRIVVQMRSQNPPGEIIGMTADIKDGALDNKLAAPFVYYPQSHLFFGFGTLVVRVQGDPLAMSRPITKLVHELDPELAVADVVQMQQWIDKSLERPRFQTRLLTAFAAVALLLAVIGIYGVMSYGVAQRRHEIGIRLALGAQKGNIGRMILARAARLCVIGLMAGSAGALALGRYLETLLFDVKPSDPATLALVATLLLCVAVAASYIPAHRAANLDPLECLRVE